MRHHFTDHRTTFEVATTRLRNALGFVICFMATNPVFLVLGINGFVLLLALVLLTVTSMRVVAQESYLAVYALGAIYLITAAGTAAFNATSTPLVFAGFFLLACFTVIQINYRVAVRYVEWATRMFAIFIVLALIGVVYHSVGGEPLFTLTNPDGRDNYFYLTTFSNSVLIILRPSAIYDEPGTFSFFICITVALRSLLGMPKRPSAILLLGGLITQSITHVIFIVIWGTWAMLSIKTRRKNFTRIWGLGLFILSTWMIYQSGVLDWSFERTINFYENPWMNPRQRYFDNALVALADSAQGLWFGFDQACIRRLPSCTNLGENPLTPLIYGGLLAAWPYYAFLLFAFSSLLYSRNGLIYVAVGVLLLQRPYFLEFPYSATMALIFVVAVEGPMRRIWTWPKPIAQITSAKDVMPATTQVLK